MHVSTIFFLVTLLTSFNFTVLGGNIADEWTLHSTVDGVEIYYKIAKCENISTVFLKVNNTNSQDVKVTWEEEFWTNAFHIAANPQGAKELTVKAKQALQNECGNFTSEQCTIPIIKVASIPILIFTGFNAKNVTVLYL
ncbi:hypothetical protein GCM10023187_47490 [Nibrella viscosa]|uniref:Uncharacterized protein n=2 Tax=Nibrella viscosa TaxID=1084524 RepID=A0ABP8KTK5_9BACT